MTIYTLVYPILTKNRYLFSVHILYKCTHIILCDKQPMFNTLSPQDASKNHFSSLKNDLISYN